MNKGILILLSAAMLLSCGNRTSSSGAAGRAEATAKQTTTQTDPAGVAKPARYTYKVTGTYPHSTAAYTQGLIWHDGYLYEGTGLRGRSQLRKVELVSGEAERSVDLERRYFGEGIALLGGKIYQLTWQEGRAMVYDAATFRRESTFSYDGEGWGLATDGEKLYMSDGTDRIQVRNPETFSSERTVNVTLAGRPLSGLNELEWIDGELWTNIYGYMEVVRIDPNSGVVTGVVDFGGIISPADVSSSTDVFNGIAYDPATGDIYVTGKNWNKVYKVTVEKI